MNLKVSEKSVLRAVLDYLSILEKQGKIAWFGRFQTGSYPIQHGNKASYVRAGRVGSADIICMMNNGRFLAIEVKSSTGQLSLEQKDFRDRIVSKGGNWLLARSVSDVEFFFR